jgi:predicted Zn finger-like uncharacterized protein
MSDLLDDADTSAGAGGSVVGAGDDNKYFLRCGRCNAAYEVAADVVGTDGARVKCEVCGHTWFQAANRLQVLTDGYVLKVRIDPCVRRVYPPHPIPW